MADFQIPETPEYTENIRMLEPTDRAHANIFNAIFHILIKNIAFLKKKVEKKIVIGPAGTKIENGTTLFVIEDWVEPDPPKVFNGAAYDNMIFAEHAPTTGENWAEMFSGKGGRAGEDNSNIITGKLVVSEEEPSDATFFAKINQ